MIVSLSLSIVKSLGAKEAINNVQEVIERNGCFLTTKAAS
jgi:hypothetical protein